MANKTEAAIRQDQADRETGARIVCRVCKQSKPAYRFPYNCSTKSHRTGTCTSCADKRARERRKRPHTSTAWCRKCAGLPHRVVGERCKCGLRYQPEPAVEMSPWRRDGEPDCGMAT